MSFLSLSGLTKRYAETDPPAVDGLSLEIEAGETFVLVGPSGCGKSTALRAIAGLETLSAGTITLDGRDLRDVSPKDRDVAMVFQGYALYPHLSVQENIAFPLRMRSVGAVEQRKRIAEVAELLDLSSLLNRLPHELSGGQRQRVAMARAIVRRPKLFLFDEPLSNLDAKLRHKLRVDLATLLRSLGATSVYVTHDQVEAMTLGSRVAVLNQGKLVQVAPPRRLYQDPEYRFVAEFVGSPAINVIPCLAEGGVLSAFSGRHRFGAEDSSCGSSVTTCVAAIRPEHVRVGTPNEGQLTGVVTLVEQLGPETHLHVSVFDETLRVRAGGECEVASGQTVGVTFDHRFFFFDATNGRRLRRAQGSA